MASGFLELGTDVFADIDVRDVDGEDLEGGADVEAACEHDLGDGVGAFEDDFVGIRGADGGDDTLADAGDDGFLFRSANKAVEVGADGDAGADFHLDTVFGNAVDGAASGAGGGAVDDFRVNRGADGLYHGFIGALGGEVDGAGAIPIELDAGFACGDECLDGREDVAACEEVGFDFVDVDFDAGFLRGDAGVNDRAVRYLAEAHGDEIGEADVGTGEPGSQPDAEEGEDDEGEDEAAETEDD